MHFWSVKLLVTLVGVVLLSVLLPVAAPAHAASLRSFVPAASRHTFQATRPFDVSGGGCGINVFDSSGSYLEACISVDTTPQLQSSAFVTPDAAGYCANYLLIEIDNAATGGLVSQVVGDTGSFCGDLNGPLGPFSPGDYITYAEVCYPDLFNCYGAISPHQYI